MQSRPRTDRDSARLKAWSDEIAPLIADALIDGGIVDPANLERAMEIIGVELLARLFLGDHPSEGDLESPSADRFGDGSTRPPGI